MPMLYKRYNSRIWNITNEGVSFTYTFTNTRSTDNARTEVMKASSEDSKKALINSWLETESVPIEQATLGKGSSQSLLMKVVMFFAQRPLYVFGLLYFAKRILKYLEELGTEEIEGGEL